MIIIRTLYDISISNLRVGYKYIWAGMRSELDFINKSLGDPKQLNPARLRPIPIFRWDAKFPYNHYSDIKCYLQSRTGVSATNTFEPGLNPTWFYWQVSAGPKTIRFSPAQTHSHFLWDAKTPNFSTIILQTLNSCPTQTCVSATNTFEPGWFLLDLHWEMSRWTQNNSIPPGSKPIPFFYGTPNFPIIIIQTLNPSQSRSCVSATNTFKPSWIQLGFWLISVEEGTLKQFRSSPAQTHSHFLWDAKLPYNHSSDNKFLSQSQTCVSATNAFEPSWILNWFHSQAGYGTQNTLIQLGSDPFPSLYGTPNFLYDHYSDNNFLSQS